MTLSSWLTPLSSTFLSSGNQNIQDFLLISKTVTLLILRSKFGSQSHTFLFSLFLTDIELDIGTFFFDPSIPSSLHHILLSGIGPSYGLSSCFLASASQFWDYTASGCCSSFPVLPIFEPGWEGMFPSTVKVEKVLRFTPWVTWFSGYRTIRFSPSLLLAPD